MKHVRPAATDHGVVAIACLEAFRCGGARERVIPGCTHMSHYVAKVATAKYHITGVITSNKPTNNQISKTIAINISSTAHRINGTFHIQVNAIAAIQGG